MIDQWGNEIIVTIDDSNRTYVRDKDNLILQYPINKENSDAAALLSFNGHNPEE